ncbi:uncharacterized protein LTR77_002054 [Saxophila tyrrhenica]|uniref:Uncharacterized protein n=1 Tax=Saxophila tyrrhenica TaxID=1690608 RepID=A0AAV9PIC1_9PEZI|nr:hypothetical protein LTR77_002054 [Saxophila tyrrhenica]
MYRLLIPSSTLPTSGAARSGSMRTFVSAAGSDNFVRSARRYKITRPRNAKKGPSSVRRPTMPAPSITNAKMRTAHSPSSSPTAEHAATQAVAERGLQGMDATLPVLTSIHANLQLASRKLQDDLDGSVPDYPRWPMEPFIRIYDRPLCAIDSLDRALENVERAIENATEARSAWDQILDACEAGSAAESAGQATTLELKHMTQELIDQISNDFRFAATAHILLDNLGRLASDAGPDKATVRGKWREESNLDSVVSLLRAVTKDLDNIVTVDVEDETGVWSSVVTYEA